MICGSKRVSYEREKVLQNQQNLKGISMWRNQLSTWLSLAKQRFYCNKNLFVFLKSDRTINEIQPRMSIENETISSARELERYRADRNLSNNFLKFKYLLKHGCKLYLLLDSGTVAAHSFICRLSSFKPYLYNNHSLFQRENSYYHFFVHVFEEYRGNRLQPFMNTVVLKDTISNNETVFTTTPLDNHVARKGIERAGYVELGVLRYKRIGPITIRKEFTRSSGRDEDQSA